MASHAHAATADHASHDDHGHGHHVTSAFVLKGILGLLLILTILTVGQAQVEKWVGHTFDVMLPNWVNVVVVMAIATVKATFVLLYFMHLRHDNPINAVIFGFTVLGVAIFLFFTFLDIGNRGYIDEEKYPMHKLGGSGEGITVNRPYPPYARLTGTIPVYASLPLYVGAVEARVQEIEYKHLPKYHPALLDARAAELIAKPTDAMLKLIDDASKKNVTMSKEEAARRIAFDETLPKARDMAAAEVASEFIHEFEHHLEHGQMPHPDVMKAIETRLGPATSAKLKEIAAAHFRAIAPVGLGGTDEQSSRNFNRAKKGRTPGLYDAPVEKPAHSAH